MMRRFSPFEVGLIFIDDSTNFGSMYSTPFFWFILLTFCLLLLGGCEESTPAQAGAVATTSSFSPLTNWVDTAHVQAGSFQRELLSHGKLMAQRQAELRFVLAAPIVAISVANGQAVEAGRLIASLDDTSQRQAIAEAEVALAQADLERKDLLLTAGHLQPDSASVPAPTWALATLQSGHRTAQLALAKAHHQRRQTEIRAPFAGRIADLKAQPHQQANLTEPLCLLLDLDPLRIEFSVLETELDMVTQGALVQIEPVALPHQAFTGRITEINPRVDDNGQLRVFARVRNPRGQLLPGMSAQVRLQQAIPDQLIIPKSAVVLRQGRPVAFVYQRDTAYWHYVTPGLENSQHYTIDEGLEASQTVITQGNLNLGHLTPVRVER
jgi:RND family efflux transporter MFP subunit